MCDNKRTRWVWILLLLAFWGLGASSAQGKKGRKGKKGNEQPPEIQAAETAQELGIPIGEQSMRLIEVGDGQAGPPQEDPWLRLDSQHFTFFGNTAASELIDIARGLEGLRFVFGRLADSGGTGADAEAGLPIWIYVFKNGASIDGFRLRDGHGGYVVAHPHGIYTAVEAGAGASVALPLVYQQFIHHLLARHFPGAPLWFRHGLAELYANFAVQGGEQGEFAELGRPRLDHLETLRQPYQKRLTVRRLEEMDGGAAGEGLEAVM